MIPGYLLKLRGRWKEQAINFIPSDKEIRKTTFATGNDLILAFRAPFPDAPSNVLLVGLRILNARFLQIVSGNINFESSH